MRACITKSRSSAAPIRQATAVCHSSRSCSAFGTFHDVGGCILKGDELAAAK
jgi:hypothetical protein